MGKDDRGHFRDSLISVDSGYGARGEGNLMDSLLFAAAAVVLLVFAGGITSFHPRHRRNH